MLGNGIGMVWHSSSNVPVEECIQSADSRNPGTAFKHWNARSCEERPRNVWHSNDIRMPVPARNGEERQGREGGGGSRGSLICC